MYFVVILSGYALASLFFFKNPKILHKKKNIRFIANNISHRGGAAEYYENTLTAFARSLVVGSQMLELDCHITKDKKVVVVHDNDLRRLTGMNKFVNRENYDNLPPLQSSIPIDFLPGCSFTATSDETNLDVCIPLLEDVFKKFSNVPINIDIKIDDDDLINAVAELILKYGREAYTVWGSSNIKVANKCYAKNPIVNLFFSSQRVFTLLLLYYTGLLPFFPIKESFLEIFLPAIYLRHPEIRGGHSKWLLKLANFFLMRRELFLHLRERGIRVYLWVLNDEQDFEAAFKLGASGVMTDAPSKLENFLNRNPQYRS